MKVKKVYTAGSYFGGQRHWPAIAVGLGAPRIGSDGYWHFGV